MIESMFEKRLRERLESGKLAPAGVRVRTLTMNPNFVNAGSRIEVDAVVEFSFDHMDGKSVKAVLEFKSRLTPMVLEGAIHQVLKNRNNLRSIPEFDDLYPMLAAPYISESVQRRCKEVGVGYIDLNGTFAVIHKNIYVDVVRPAVEFKNPQGIKNIYSPRSRRVLRVLLAHPYTSFRLEELASKAQVSLGQVAQVTKRLHEQGYLERTSNGRHLARPRKLLRLLAQELKSDYATNRNVVQAFTELPAKAVADSITELCARKGIEFAFTLASGLESHERNVRQELTAAYVGVTAAEVQSELRLEAVGRGANVIIMTAPEQDNTTAGGVFYERRTLSNGLIAVNPVQLYIDFMLQGGRGEEQAEFLLDNSLGFQE
jgi:DNA-binding MarR family transcriptional regulator